VWESIENLKTRKFIDDRWVASLEEFAEICGLGKRTIERNIKDGMPLHKASLQKFKIVDVIECQEWRSANTKKSKANNTKKGKEISVDIPPEDKDSDGLEEQINDIQGKIKQANEMLQLKGRSKSTHEDADRISKIMEALTKAVKLGEQTRELIPKRDTEKVIVEVVATLISGYKKDVKILPKECEDRPEAEIREILENNYKANIENFQKIAKSDMLTDSKIFDVIEVVVNLMLNKRSISEIIDKLYEIKIDEQ